MGIVVTLVIVMAVALSVRSRHKPSPGLVEGRLSPCPATPNCVCSEHPGAKGFVEPLLVTGDAEAAWQRARQVIVATGGKILYGDDSYLAAIYISPLWRFVDDFELRLDREQGRLHLRSASRVGYSDLGVNARRVERFRQLFDDS